MLLRFQAENIYKAISLILWVLGLAGILNPFLIFLKF